VVEEAVPRMVEVDVVVVGLPCRWSCRHTRGAMVMTGTRRGSRRGRGDVEVDTVRAVVDIEEGRRCKRGRQGGNRRVDEVDAVKPH